MSTSPGVPSAGAVAELAGLVVGREPPTTVERLRVLADRLAAGGSADEAEVALIADVRHRYGRELSELEHPDP